MISNNGNPSHTFVSNPTVPHYSSQISHLWWNCWLMDSISKLHYSDFGFVQYTKLISFRNKSSKIHQQKRAVGGRTPAARRASRQTTETFYICGTSRGDASSGRPGNDGVLQKWRRHYLRSHHNEHGIHDNKIKIATFFFHLLFIKYKCFSLYLIWLSPNIFYM